MPATTMPVVPRLVNASSTDAPAGVVGLRLPEMSRIAGGCAGFGDATLEDTPAASALARHASATIGAYMARLRSDETAATFVLTFCASASVSPPSLPSSAMRV